MLIAAAGIAAAGLVTFLIILIVGAVIAGVAYWILSHAPLPPIVPAGVAGIIFLIALVYALQGL